MHKKATALLYSSGRIFLPNISFSVKHILSLGDVYCTVYPNIQLTDMNFITNNRQQSKIQCVLELFHIALIYSPLQTAK